MAGESFQAAFDEGVFSAKFGEVTLIGDSPAPGPTEPVVEKDVNFYDYDGTLLHSYTLEEAQALTALPDGPSHDGLVFQGWNWTLAGVKALTRPMTIGAMYITDDGATRLYITIPDRMPLPFLLSVRITQTVANGVVFDWGDGSATETVAGTGAVSLTHEYTSAGDYVIRLVPDDGCDVHLGNGTSGQNIFVATSDATQYISNILTKVEIGKNVTRMRNTAFCRCCNMETITVSESCYAFENSCFDRCRSLRFFVIPPNTEGLGNYHFNHCINMKRISFGPSCVILRENSLANMFTLERLDLPDAATGTGYGGFANAHSIKAINSKAGLKVSGNSYYACYLLPKIVIPDTATDITANCFNNCFSLLELDIPASVTSIAASAIAYCYGLQRLRFLPTTPPTVANANAFTGIPATCIVEVPAASLATYQAATNYGGIAAQMVGV